MGVGWSGVILWHQPKLHALLQGKSLNISIYQSDVPDMLHEKKQLYIYVYMLFLVFDGTLRKSSIAMEHGPFEDVFRIKHGDIPLLC